MKVLDLFSGLNGWSQAFKDRSHEVITVDNQKRFKPDICEDVMALSPGSFKEYGPFDIVLASPPCNCFSVASLRHHWDKATGRPKDQKTVEAIKLVGHTINLILNLQPRFWILENPRGMMRRVLGPPAVTTFFAAWGHFALKPTDLWGVLPPVKWKQPLKWEKAPRGSRKGIQGIDGNNRIKAWPENLSTKVRTPAARAKIPYALSEAVCLVCEKEI